MTSRDELFETIRTEIERLSTQIIDHVDDDEYPMELVIGRRQGLKWALKEIDKNFYEYPLPQPIRIYKIGDKVEITKNNDTIFTRGEIVTIVGMNGQGAIIANKDCCMDETMIENLKHLT